MSRYKIITAYDGTEYAGWQYQKNAVSISAVLQDTFYRVFKQKVTLYGASRTDTGVHALGHVAVFDTDLPVAPDMLRSAWNNQLPNDILIRELVPVADDFNPFFNIKEKVYWYHFFVDPPLPFAARYGLYYKYPLNMQKLKQALAAFTGTHDFRSFCSSQVTVPTIKTINVIDLSFIKRFNVYRIEVRGPGFLHNQVRRIVGAALTVASSDELSVAYLKQVLDERNPRQRLLCAPAHGLTLCKIIYHSGE